MPDITASGRVNVAITPSDTTPLTFKALYIGVSGNVAIAQKSNKPADPDTPGPVVTFANVPAGFILPVHGVRVMATGTTASAIIAMDW